MPVLSPQRSSASALSGSYRSTFSSSPLDRSYFSSSSYSPRITSFTERYSSRSYTDSDGRRIYARSGSITEDGITTRYREETREGSTKRDSFSSRDSAIGSSYRDGLDYTRRDRDSSLTRNDRLSSLNVGDSVAELREKYSAAKYVPAIHRKNDNISRSKSINDIGLPPIESKTNKKKVNEALNYNNSVLYPNNTNNDNMTIETEDDNGNRTASVADLRKKFDIEMPCCNTPKNNPLQIDGPTVKISENKFKKNDIETQQKSTNGKLKSSSSNGVKRTSKLNGDTLSSQTIKEVAEINLKNELAPKLNGSNEIGDDDDEDDEEDDEFGTTETINNYELNNSENSDEKKDEKHNYEIKGGSGDDNSIRHRVNNFASYIPMKDNKKCDNTNTEEVQVNGLKEADYLDTKQIGKSVVQNDLNASPKLSRSAISPSNSSTTGSNSINSASLSRRSSDRYIDDDSERNYNSNIRSLASPARVLGLNGLKNIGNTCFMNSVIQCLSNTKLLLEYLRKDAYSDDINVTISSMKGALIKAFTEVIKELWSEDSSDRVVNTVSLKSQIQRFAPRFMGYAQQDAQEFLRYLLEGLHEDVNRVTEKPKPILTEIDDKLGDAEKAQQSWMRYLRMDNSRIVDIFVGQLKSTLRCTHCQHSSVTFDPFWDLSLPVPQKTGQLRLSQCLDSFTKEETLDGDEKPTCSKCKERRKCTKSFSIQKFPKILVIHLKRFSPTERFRGKLNCTVDFPLEGLDMNNYAADNVSPCKYNLYAISNHSGTTYSGHYTAYCRHPYAHTWNEYNDSRVSSISPKSIVSSEAYVLFYEQEGQKSHL